MLKTLASANWAGVSNMVGEVGLEPTSQNIYRFTVCSRCRLGTRPIWCGRWESNPQNPVSKTGTYTKFRHFRMVCEVVFEPTTSRFQGGASDQTDLLADCCWIIPQFSLDSSWNRTKSYGFAIRHISNLSPGHSSREATNTPYGQSGMLSPKDTPRMPVSTPHTAPYGFNAHHHCAFTTGRSLG